VVQYGLANPPFYVGMTFDRMLEEHLALFDVGYLDRYLDKRIPGLTRGGQIAVRVRSSAGEGQLRTDTSALARNDPPVLT